MLAMNFTFILYYLEETQLCQHFDDIGSRSASDSEI